MHVWCVDLGLEYGVVRRPNKKAMEQAQRLRLIRERIHKMRTQTEMAQKLNVEYNRYNHWESGVQTIPTDQAVKLKHLTPGVDLDWIFEGEEGGLSVDALNKLSGHKPD